MQQQLLWTKNHEQCTFYTKINEQAYKEFSFQHEKECSLSLPIFKIGRGLPFATSAYP